MVCCFGQAENIAVAEAARLNGHARVGFENNLMLPDATTAPDNAGTSIGDAILPRIAAGRRGKSEECVGATIFLASDASSYVSGQVYLIDGGRF